MSSFTSSCIFAFISSTIVLFNSRLILVYIPLSRLWSNSTFVFLPNSSLTAVMYRNFKPLLYILAPILSFILISFILVSSFNFVLSSVMSLSIITAITSFSKFCSFIRSYIVLSTLVTTLPTPSISTIILSSTLITLYSIYILSFFLWFLYIFFIFS